MNKDSKEIADRLDNLTSCIAKGTVNMTILRDSVADMRYAIAKLRAEAGNEEK